MAKLEFIVNKLLNLAVNQMSFKIMTALCSHKQTKVKCWVQ